MNRRVLTTIGAVLMVTALFAQPKAYEVKELTLKNGMTVWLNEDHSQPKVYGAVVVKAGAKDCPGTGIAHYFEHIMFKGTDRMGTIDYEAERPWLDSISAQYDLLSQTKDDTQRAAIQKHINELSLKAADYTIPNEFNRLISRYGGSGLNAGTGYDVTYYYNTFLPQFMEQWCWLNSERLIHPVFRGFQGELENVYEEKNRSADGMSEALEKALGTIFKDHPYGQAIIGTTENLKNPRLSDMEAFYKKYYVASNMGLILCGDIDADKLQPLLEQTFGRVQTGPVPQRNIQPMPPTGQGQLVGIKVPIPIIKVQAQVGSAPTDYDADAPALDIANALLTNGKAGYLDSLMNEHVIMMGMSARMAFNDAGLQILAAVPKLPFGSKKKAIKACLAQVERIKRGDFTDSHLEEMKREALMDAEKSLETISDRAAQMVDAFSQGQSWEAVLQQLKTIRNLKREDIIRVANKYFTNDYITLVKKFGMSDKETLKQPGFKPIQPKNTDAKSAFAKQLEQIAVNNKTIKTIDVEGDAQRQKLNDHVTFYYKENPMNDIFTFRLRYLDGTRHTPILKQVCEYLKAIGTDSLKKQQMEAAWQRMNTTMEIVEGDRYTSFTLTGPDANFVPSLQLLAHFLSSAKADKEALKEVKDGLRIENKSFGKQKDDVLMPMIQWAMRGKQSSYLNQLSLSEGKKLTSEQLLEAFRQLQTYDCELLYCGQLSAEYVATESQRALPLSHCQKPIVDDHRKVITYTAPTVYFYHVPKSRQNYVVSYETLAPAKTESERATADMWAQYMGGGMSSVLFQNIREFQSLAYTTQGLLYLPNSVRHPNDSLAFLTITGTQADKTLQAVGAIDSLMRQMPLKQENAQAAQQELLNDIQNSYPSFRHIATTIANMRLDGYSADPNKRKAEVIPTLSVSDMEQYYHQHVARNQRVWIIIGDRKTTDLKALEKYGNVVELKKEDIIR